MNCELDTDNNTNNNSDKNNNSSNNNIEKLTIYSDFCR